MSKLGPADRAAVRHTIDVLRASKTKHEDEARYAKHAGFGARAVDEHLAGASRDQAAIDVLEELLR